MEVKEYLPRFNKALVIDDHELNLTGLKTFLTEEKIAKEVIGCLSGSKGLELLLNEDPELCFVDLSLPEIYGTDLIKLARDKGYDGLLIVMTAYSADVNIYHSYIAGANLYLPKEKFDNGLIKVLKELEQDSEFSVYGRDIADTMKLLDYFADLYRSEDSIDPEEVILTMREKAILRGVLEGKDRIQISEENRSSKRTVDTHLTNIFTKYKVLHIHSLVALIRRHKRIELYIYDKIAIPEALANRKKRR